MVMVIGVGECGGVRNIRFLPAKSRSALLSIADFFPPNRGFDFLADFFPPNLGGKGQLHTWELVLYCVELERSK
jgi:hypothetical protein